MTSGSGKAVWWGLIACGAVLVVGVIVASFGSRGNGHGTAASGVRRRVVLNDIEVTIFDARSGKRPSSRPDQAEGIVIRVSIRLKNVGVTPATGTITNSTFFGGEGKTYGLDSSKNTTFSGLPPRSSGRGWLVFDVSAAAVRGGRLVLVECGAPLLDNPNQRCATAMIDLGLS